MPADLTKSFDAIPHGLAALFMARETFEPLQDLSGQFRCIVESHPILAISHQFIQAEKKKKFFKFYHFLKLEIVDFLKLMK